MGVAPKPICDARLLQERNQYDINIVVFENRGSPKEVHLKNETSASLKQFGTKKNNNSVFIFYMLSKSDKQL